MGLLGLRSSSNAADKIMIAKMGKRPMTSTRPAMHLREMNVVIKSMNFHPVQRTLLLVGTDMGETFMWKLNSGRKIMVINFEVWNIGVRSPTLQALVATDNNASGNRVMWSPDGSYFGIAYSKHIIHLFACIDNQVRRHIEIEAHFGSVNDLAFYYLTEKLCTITCGEDKMIKVWDVATGDMRYQYRGHKTSVYSICPDQNTDVKWILSTAADGTITKWIYDNHIDFLRHYKAPNRSCNNIMAYGMYGTRFFISGTKSDGSPYIAEWNHMEGTVLRTYLGLGKQSKGVVQFDITKNRYLVAGDECKIKIWDMDNENLLKIIGVVNHVLPKSPCIRINKEGSLLAVSTSDNGIAILKFVPANPKEWELIEFNKQDKQANLHYMRLLDRTVSSRKIAQLTYTNSGSSILALDYNGIHKLWKLQNIESPQRWLPSETFMTNDTNHTNHVEAVPCFALRKDDYLLMSASGEKISVFSMSTLKARGTIMPPPPAATFLAFHPQDNDVIAIGMEDSSIQIRNYRTQEVKKLMGHDDKVTGLAFSSVLGVLVSSSTNAQLCVWALEGWENKACKFLEIPVGTLMKPHNHTRVKFHQDQMHVLVVHQTQLAIYYASKLDHHVNRWIAPHPNLAITDATYSCDSQSIFTCFQGGSVCIFSGLELIMQYSIGRHIPSSPSSPVAITGHPSNPNQFGIGMSDGGVYVLELLSDSGDDGPTWQYHCFVGLR